MTSFATPAEVATLLGRAFDAAETAQCQGFLDEAHEQILDRIPDLLAKITAGTIKQATVARVERRSGRRVMLNPEGKQNEKIDDYSYGRDDTIVSGEAYISEEEWGWLIPTVSSGDSFTITAGNAGPRVSSPPRLGRTW